jgi:hypothetical protein
MVRRLGRKPSSNSFLQQFDFEEYDKHVFMLGKDPQTDILMKRKLAHFS